ncbi:MAG TPA: LacI family DNA-binding transcriptional regulator [Phycisphaerae bacterium]|nr:LacI family DNA-binding transcriptional regulator [Phycisphaerae bacterium]
MPIKSKNNTDIMAKKEILPTSNQIVVGFDQSPSTVKSPEKVSIREVARQAGVSVATVSMVLNDNPRISRATQLRVQKMIELMGYRPNRLAQSLSSKYTQVIAVMLPPLRHAFADAYFGEIISGIADRVGKLGHKMLIEQAKPQYIRESKHIELYERRFVDGVLCLGFNEKHTFLSDFANREYPMVLVDNRFGNQMLDCVHCDYRLGSQQAMNCLLQLGHRSIGMIYAAQESPTSRDVIEVYTQRLKEVGVDPLESWKVDGLFTDEGGAAAAERLITAHPRMTAILCGNDKMALGAIRYLMQHGYRVPQDISVVGFDDIQHLAYANPSLTTVHLPLYELGVLACERLVERIRGKVEQIHEVLPTHLVLRESTGIAQSHK